MKDEEPKQETLEEAALKWFMTANKREIIFDLGWIKIFEAGAKWQEKRMYSEEEVEEILYKHTEDLLAGNKITLEKWFEQFKKK